MKLRTLLATALLLTLTSIAQTGHGSFTTSDFGTDVTIKAQTIGPDGYLYYIGDYRISTTVKIYLAKCDTTGNMVWEKRIGYNTWGTGIAVDPNSIYISGYTGNDATALRFDLNGNLIWEKRMMGAPYVFGNDIIAYQQGCVIGGMYSAPAPYKAGFIVRFDSSGNTVWNKELHLPPYNHTFIHGLCADNAGNIYACGGAGQFAPTDVGTLTKFDPNGNVMWTRCFSDTAVNISFYECMTAGNDIIAAGVALPGDPLVLVRMDPNGFFYGVMIGDTATSFSLGSISATPFNTILVTGDAGNSASHHAVLYELDYTFSFVRGIENQGCHTLTGAGYYDSHCYISGWSGNTNYQYHRGSSDYAWNFGCGFTSLSVTVHPFINLLMGFPTDSTSSVNIVDSVSLVNSINIPFTTCDNLAGIPDPVSSSTFIYPNPSADFCSLVFAEPFHENAIIEITDINGKLVRTCYCEAGATQIEIDISAFPCGEYFLNSKKQFLGKFIVER